MDNVGQISNELKSGLDRLGLISDDSLLYFVADKENYKYEPEIWFQLEKAESYTADAVFFKKGMYDYIPQIYIYDYTSSFIENDDLVKIHKDVWTGGEIPIVCVFTNTEVKILDTTSPIEIKGEKYSPKYLIENLKLVSSVHKIYNKTFAQRIKAGTYWDNSNVSFNKSSYKKLTELLRKVINKFTEESGLENKKDIVQKFIIQCILVKYLEERKDFENNTVFPPNFFEQYGSASEFSDTLRNKSVFSFFSDLNSEEHFNGGIFGWSDADKQVLINANNEAFIYLANVLEGYTEITDQKIIQFEDNFSRLYSFNHIPVELISRLYEEFIIKDSKQKKKNKTQSPQNDGVAYTPSHLVKLLINEAMPLHKSPENINDFKILDPACGSAIFLVVAFKRLVQWWRCQNQYKKPDLITLKGLLNLLYGVDTDKKAIQISVFSLCIALCDELSPKQIWNDLKFEQIEGSRIFNKDFFQWKNEIDPKLKFNLIIGNPPFERGALNDELKQWVGNDFSVIIPQSQIALKFLSDSLGLLNDNGLCCLIVKAMPLLYSNSDNSKKYLDILANKFELHQIFDFTPLARNGVLWDGADVDAAAVFVANRKPNKDRNILHAIFRRTKSNVERLYFEIDHYDLNWILREQISMPYLFKINLLGGGRSRYLISKIERFDNLSKLKKKLSLEVEEGMEIGISGNNNPDYLYEIPTLPTRAFTTEGISIDYEDFPYLTRDIKPKKIPVETVFRSPNILIKENIALPMIFNKTKDFSYQRNIIGIASKNKEIKILEKIYENLVLNKKLYQFYILVTSGQLLINKNTVILLEDIMRLPIVDDNYILSDIDKNIINDVLNINQYFIRNPERSEAIKVVKENDLTLYANEFSKIINELYSDTNNSFKLTDIINFENENLIGTLFSYDDKLNNLLPTLRTEKEVSNIDGLINFNINESLSSTRIVRYYTTNKVLFVKPNQKRFWTASIAYRDADEVFADILNNQ